MKVPADEPQSAAGGVVTGDATGAPARLADAGSTRSAQELALAELRRQLEAWKRHEPGARLGADPEELHQMRVAVRRIDSILSLLKRQLPKELAHARRAAKSLLRTLGAARDFDVQLAELDRYCAGLSPAECPAAAPLRARLETDRAHARAQLIRALDREATRQWLQALHDGSANPPATAGAAPAAMVMPERIQKRYRKLRKDVRKLTAKSPMDEYHGVRRRAKLLRYALEPSADLFGKPVEGMLRALRRLQDGLGEHQDAYLAKNRLQALAADAEAGLPAETLFLMGRLAEHHLNVTTRARKTLTRAWKKVRGKRWRTLRAKMAQVRTAALAASVAESGVPSAQPDPAAPAPVRQLRH
jgi:CHAD domain-containing protein